MDNYSHEIPLPENSALRRYLWFDYFHDSKIFQVAFDHRKRTVTLSLDCCCDYDDVWYKLKGDYDSRCAQMEPLLDRFIYYLKFSGVEYFHSERLPLANDYINGRFKDSAILRKLCKDKQQDLFHFRIQIDDGYDDIIFKKFSIRKKVGRINPKETESYEVKEQWTNEQIHLMLDNDDFDDDFNRYLALSTLHRSNDASILRYARTFMSNQAYLEISKTYSAYLLGKYGDLSDIPSLVELYFIIENQMCEQPILRCSTLLPKRNIMDAIELINLRCRNI